MFSFGAPQSTPSFSFTNPNQQQQQPMQQNYLFSPNTQTTATTTPQQLATLASHPFQYIQQSLDPNSLGYRFRTIFYNLLPQGQSSSVASKPLNVPDRLWNQAVNENPDPQKCVPVIANGPGDLNARAKWQQECITAHAEKTRELLNRLENLSDSNKSQALMRVRERQGRLNERLLRVQARLEPLKRIGVGLDESEAQISQRLRSLQKQMAEHAEVEGVVNQLQALLKDGRIDLDAQLRERVIKDPNVVQELANLLNSHSEVLIKAVERIGAMNKNLEMMLSGYSL